MNRLISVVVPVRNEEKNVPVLVAALEQQFARIGLHYEVIFVDDGSTDGTYAAIKAESARNANVYGLRFRRNFGQTTAIKAGFDHARGEICITLDGDMQHDPSYIPDLLAKIDEGYDLVCSYRSGRADGLLRRVPSRLANLLARRFSSVKVRDFGSTYRAYRMDVVRDLPIYGEMHRFIPVYVSMASNRITEIPIKVQPRLHGRSNYGLQRTFRVLSDLLVLMFFSKYFDRPIHIFGYITFLLGFPGLAVLGGLFVRKVAWGVPVMLNGPLFMVAALMCLVAVQLFTTGIVCEYLVRILFRGGPTRPYSIAEQTPDGRPARG